jgi:hypothetical protein
LFGSSTILRRAEILHKLNNLQGGPNSYTNDLGKKGKEQSCHEHSMEEVVGRRREEALRASPTAQRTLGPNRVRFGPFASDRGQVLARVLPL